MRIVVTSAGKKELKEILQDSQPHSHRYFNSITESNSVVSRKLYTKSRKSSKTIQTSKPDKPVNITLNLKKIILPKNISEKYVENPNDESSASLLPDIFLNLKKDSIKSSLSCSSNTLPVLKEFYTLREIIPEQTLSKLKNKLQKDQRMKEKLSTVNEENFRTIPSNVNIEQVNENAERMIKADQVNLIQYLNGKTTITENFIKKLAIFEEERMNRLNKICQISLHNSEEHEKFIRKVQVKLMSEKLKEKDLYKRGVISMERNLNRFKCICAEGRKALTRERYMYALRDMQEKYWDRYNVDRFFRKEKDSSVSLLNKI